MRGERGEIGWSGQGGSEGTEVKGYVSERGVRGNELRVGERGMHG